MRGVHAAASLCLLLAGCSSNPEVKTTAAEAGTTAGPHSFTLFALAEVRGQVGPCGCTSDPLGDLSRTSQVVADARKAGPVLVLDAGSLLYSDSPLPAAMAAQDNLKADLLVRTYKDPLAVAAIGLGPADLAEGPAHVRVPREVVNLPASSPIAVDPPRVIEIGGAHVGVFGVISSDAIANFTVADPIPAAKTAIEQLRAHGADVVVALVQAANKRDAVQLVRGIGGIDIAIAGLGLNAPEPAQVEATADHVGDAWLVIPGNRGQVVSKLDITVRGKSALVDAVGPGAATARTAAITRQLAALDADLAKFAADKTADPAFVATKQQERTQLAAERDQLAAHPLVVPPTGNYFTLEQVKINKGLACNGPVQAAIADYDKASGEANLKAAANIAVPPAAAGTASYVGSDKCSDCHAEASEFWGKTIHAKAWATLVERNQQYDLSCIGCHVTGWEKPGGTNLAHTDGLRDVQCETCHGPGSIHVAKGGQEGGKGKPFAIARGPAPELCASQCHTKEHSDTFQLEAYLRDITGPGHAEKRRKQLGDGPTGHELRAAALAKAGATIGAGCTR